jgi:hypothetical protein
VSAVVFCSSLPVRGCKKKRETANPWKLRNIRIAHQPCTVPQGNSCTPAYDSPDLSWSHLSCHVRTAVANCEQSARRGHDADSYGPCSSNWQVGPTHPTAHFFTYPLPSRLISLFYLLLHDADAPHPRAHRRAAAAVAISPHPPQHTHRLLRWMASEPVARAVAEEVARWGAMRQTGVSLRYMMEFGARPTERNLLRAAQFLHKELPIPPPLPTPSPPPPPPPPPPRRAVPAQGAPHPHRSQGARPRLAALRPLHQARHPQGGISSLPRLCLWSHGLVWTHSAAGRPDFGGCSVRAYS